jgi:hypothetical protein
MPDQALEYLLRLSLDFNRLVDADQQIVHRRLFHRDLLG